MTLEDMLQDVLNQLMGVQVRAKVLGNAERNPTSSLLKVEVWPLEPQVAVELAPIVRDAIIAELKRREIITGEVDDLTATPTKH